MYSKRLQYVRVSEDRVVLKRGINELLLSGSGVESIVEPLVQMLDEGSGREQIIDNFPGHLRPEVEKLLTLLVHRGFVTEQPEPSIEGSDLDALQASFWQNFGDLGQEALTRLGQCRIIVVGANLVTRSLVRSLLEMKVGWVTLVDHPILNNQAISLETSGWGSGFEARLRHASKLPADEELLDASLICAASDFGQPDVLLEINRTALRLEKPYLPLWLASMLGHIGPLNYPFETACLRCYTARADSNNPNYEAARAVHEHLAQNPEARQAIGILPPMAAVIGEIAAAEIVKFVTGVLPGDTVGRVIEINMASFTSLVRRVLKLPRCPDCGEIMKKASKALTIGPLIPQS